MIFRKVGRGSIYTHECMYIKNKIKKAESKTRAWAAGVMVEFEERETVEEREERKGVCGYDNWNEKLCKTIEMKKKQQKIYIYAKLKARYDY